MGLDGRDVNRRATGTKGKKSPLSADFADGADFVRPRMDTNEHEIVGS